MSVVQGDSERGIYMLVGGGGVPNFGDELIIVKWLEWLRVQPRYASTKIVLELNHMRVANSLGFKRMGHVFPSGDLSLARYRLGEKSFSDAFDMGRSFLDSSHDDSRLRRLAERLSRTEVFHLHGGGYLNDYWPSHAFSLGLGCAVKEKFGKTVVGTGLGLGPFVSDSAINRVKDAALIFDHFEVRDEVSYEYAGDSSVQGVDDVFLSPVRSEFVGGNALHVSLIGDTVDGVLENLLPSRFIDNFDRCYFWICTPQDAAAFAVIGSSHRHFVPLSVKDLLHGIPVGSSNFMLTERFHPHLVGARLGFGGVYVSNNGYYDAKHGSVIGLGSGFSSISSQSSIWDSYESTKYSPNMLAADFEVIAKKISNLNGVI